jgi:hypothetical protein
VGGPAGLPHGTTQRVKVCNALGRVVGGPTNGLARMDAQRADTEVRAPRHALSGPGPRWFFDSDAAETGWETYPTADTEVRAAVALVVGPGHGCCLANTQRRQVGKPIPRRTQRSGLPWRWWWAQATGVVWRILSGDRLGNLSHGGHRGPGSRGAGGGPGSRMLFGGYSAETGWKTYPTADTEVRAPRHAFSGPGPRWFFDSDAAETGWKTYPTADTEVRAPVALVVGPGHGCCLANTQRRQVGKPIPRGDRLGNPSYDCGREDREWKEDFRMGAGGRGGTRAVGSS